MTTTTATTTVDLESTDIPCYIAHFVPKKIRDVLGEVRYGGPIERVLEYAQLDIEGMRCCAMQEVHGVEEAFNWGFTPRDVLLLVALGSIYGARSRYYIFSLADFAYKSEFSRLRRDIRTYGLGRTTRFPVGVNPNTNNTIDAFVWSADVTKLVPFVQKYDLSKPITWTGWRSTEPMPVKRELYKWVEEKK